VQTVFRVVGGMGALVASPAGRAGGWATGVRAPTAADGGITTSHALLGGCGGSCMQLSGLQAAADHCYHCLRHFYLRQTRKLCSVSVLTSNKHLDAFHLQAKAVSGAALQQPLAAGANAAAAEAADRQRLMYEVQWQASSAAAASAGTPSPGASLHRQGALLVANNRTGAVMAQVR
jgi:hypothetical protein